MRSQIVDGIFVVMFLSLRKIPVTVPLVHSISGQTHGEDEVFHDWMDGGLPHCCFKFSRTACSIFSDCEIT